MSFQNMIQDFQEDTGFSDKKLATMFDVSIPTIRRWKTSQTSPARYLKGWVRDKISDYYQD